MSDFTKGRQPCNLYEPARGSHDVPNQHECLAPFHGERHCGGTVSFCDQCGKDHHSDGYESCEREQITRDAFAAVEMVADLLTRLAAVEAERDASDDARREWEVRAAESYKAGRAAGLREAAGVLHTLKDSAGGLYTRAAYLDGEMAILELLGPGEVSGG